MGIVKSDGIDGETILVGGATVEDGIMVDGAVGGMHGGNVVDVGFTGIVVVGNAGDVEDGAALVVVTPQPVSVRMDSIRSRASASVWADNTSLMAAHRIAWESIGAGSTAFAGEMSAATPSRIAPPVTIRR